MAIWTRFFALAFALADITTAVPYPQPACTNITLSVTAAANNLKLPPFPSDTSRAAFGRYVQSFDPSTLDRKRVNGTFNVAATYCEPLYTVNGRESTVQLLLHGLAYTKEYWNGINYPNASFPGQYSWTRHANSQGFATLSIDNLGNGQSDHPDPISMVQLPLQEAIILEIFRKLRSQEFPCISTKFDNIIFVTHSYGAIVGRAIAISHPDPAVGPDAYIQTASSSAIEGIRRLAPNLRPQAASVVAPQQFAELGPAYMHIDPTSLSETVYGLPGEYDADVLAWDQSLFHTFAVGELISITSNNVSTFTGPVLYMTGVHDAIVCDSTSNITLATSVCTIGKKGNPGFTASKFPNAKPFMAYVPDATGHNANLHYSASEVFGAAHEFLQSTGF